MENSEQTGSSGFTRQHWTRPHWTRNRGKVITAGLLATGLLVWGFVPGNQGLALVCTVADNLGKPYVLSDCPPTRLDIETARQLKDYTRQALESRDRGQLDQAFDKLQKALTLAELLSQKNPDNDAWQQDLARVYSQIGNLEQRRGNALLALAALASEQEIIRRALARTPDSLDWQADHRDNLHRKGEIYQATDQWDKALELYRPAIELAGEILAREPDKIGNHFILTALHNKTGEVHESKGDLAAALLSYQAALDGGTVLAATFPEEPRLLYSQYKLHSTIGHLYEQQDNKEAAITSYENALATARVMIERAPQLKSLLLANLSLLHTMTGDLQRDQDHPDDAARNFQAAIDFYTAELGNSPAADKASRENNLHQLFALQHRIGNIRSDQTDHQTALTHFEAAMAALQELRELAPENHLWSMAIYTVHLNLGEEQQALGDTTAALSHFQSVVSNADPLVQNEPEEPAHRAYIAFATYYSGMILLDQDQKTAARAQLEQSQTLMLALMNSDWADDLSSNLMEVESILSKLGS
ncbi:tetratricopeptide repeat protein [Kiloniella laminariae]|uniref:Tetratricopeptide repeat protein n=1 Tax=Kiloniella laminariae TaxID=454162 RepID=A0ABT4LI80_9PROT|nr:tetratricopeptide repeat protein [Kiloniella laminariae]MCZ4279702.1 tetratricopeptide repeat protein [Kiloniella laminariae]